MRKKTEFTIIPEEELDLQHQGSLVGQQLYGKYQPSQTPASQTPAAGPGVAMSSQQERQQRKTPEQKPTEKREQEESSKKHHYK